MKRQKMSITQITAIFPDDATAEAWFIRKRWPNGVHCPWCHGDSLSKRNTHKFQSWRCMPCGKNFTAKTGSLMHSSKLGFRTWAIAIYLVTTSLKGIASTKLASDVSVTQKTAWHLAHRIRETYVKDHPRKLHGNIEADETYVGGKEMNKQEHKKLKQGSGYIGKQPVIGMKSRTTNTVKAVMINPVSASTLSKAIRDNVEEGATVFTDQLSGYKRIVKEGYKHQSVNHAAKQYSVNHAAKQYIDGQCHTNGIESFWSLLKRGYYGTHHYMSFKHLQRYIDEFAGRHNDRALDTIDQMSVMVKGMDGETVEV